MKKLPAAAVRIVIPALLAFIASAAHAQAQYPVRTVRIIVPTSPPGGADVVARSVAPGLSERLGQQVIVDNRAGASTMIGHEMAAKAPPDGYTLVMGISTLAINPATFKHVPYDALRDFAPITQAAIQTLVLATHPSFPARNVKELIAIAKARPGDVSFSSPGFGTNPEMGMELFLYLPAHACCTCRTAAAANRSLRWWPAMYRSPSPRCSAPCRTCAAASCAHWA